MIFNKRHLNKEELLLYKQNRCICCGQRTKPYMFECNKCFNARNRLHHYDESLEEAYKAEIISKQKQQI